MNTKLLSIRSGNAVVARRQATESDFEFCGCRKLAGVFRLLMEVVMSKKLKMLLVRAGAASGIAALASSSYAADYTALITAVDFTAAGTAVMTGMAAMATVGVLIKGGSMVLRKLGLKF